MFCSDPLPENVSDAEQADGSQPPGPTGVAVVGGPHLDDDEGKNGGVLERNMEQNIRTGSTEPGLVAYIKA